MENNLPGDIVATILPAAAPKQISLLFNIPLEILYDIFDILRFPDQVFLTHTCKSIWRLLHSRCSSIRDATHIDRSEFFKKLEPMLPDRWYCPDCSALHPIDSEDVPVLSPRGYGSHSLFVPTGCVLFESSFRRHFMHPNYAIAIRHVQLAIKLSRVGNIPQDYQDHLKKIMQKYTSSTAAVQFSVEPRVVNGRFLVKATYQFKKFSDKIVHSKYFPEKDIAETIFCARHKGPDPPDNCSAVMLLIRCLYNMLRRKHCLASMISRKGSCDQCASDYGIEFLSRRMVKITVWKDLGTGKSFRDPYWFSHDWSGDADIRDEAFPFEDGSIEKMYHSVDAVQE